MKVNDFTEVMMMNHQQENGFSCINGKLFHIKFNYSMKGPRLMVVSGGNRMSISLWGGHNLCKIQPSACTCTTFLPIPLLQFSGLVSDLIDDQDLSLFCVYMS